MDGIEIKFSVGSAVIIFAIMFFLSLILVLALLAVIVMAFVERTVSASGFAIIVVLGCLLLAVASPVFISGEVLLNRLYGIRGLSISGGTVSTLGASPVQVMEFSYVSTDFNKRVLMLSDSTELKSNWFIFPTRLFSSTSGRIRVPVFLVENDEELLRWIADSINNHE